MTYKRDKRNDRTYRSWRAMIDRCKSKRAQDFEYYAGKGIQVCERWASSFDDFLADMGERPPATTLDRYPDPNGNYEPGNCRWATHVEQQNNRANSRGPITWRGQTHPCSVWAEITGIPRHVIKDRIAEGWTPERALTENVHRKRTSRSRTTEGQSDG